MVFKIPLFKLNFDEKEEQAVLETLKSKWISIGPQCEKFEKLFAEMLSVNYAVSLSNCTTALHLALRALDIKEGDEVICPSLTFVASVNSIKYVGATPVFCDVKSVEHINIDAEQIRKLITPKTKAIIVVHMAGFPCEMNEIKSLAEEYDLKIIEDACHGPLSEYKGKKLGTIGDIGCFSFFSNKNISTGEGGMIVTNDAGLEKKFRLLRSHGMTTMSYQRAQGHATVYDVVELGYNFRMDDIRATIGIAQLKKLENDLRLREKVRSSYVEYLSGEDRVEIPFRDNTEFVSNYIMPVVLKDSTVEKRDAVRDKLHQAGIQTSVHYPPIHRFSIYKDYPANLPVTDYVTDNEITLPMYASLSSDDVEFICSNLSAVLNEY